MRGASRMLARISNAAALGIYVSAPDPALLFIFNNRHDPEFNVAFQYEIDRHLNGESTSRRIAAVCATIFQEFVPGRLAVPRLELWADGVRIEMAEGRFGVVARLAELLALQAYARQDATELSEGIALPAPLYQAGAALWRREIWVAGGFDGAARGESIRLDGSKLALKAGPSLHTPRFGHSLTCFGDTAIVIGGTSAEQRYIGSVECLTENDDGWKTLATRLSWPRFGHTATLIDSDTLIIAGGHGPRATMSVIPMAERFDLGAGRITPIPGGGAPRVGHTAHALTDRRVLLVGGYALDTVQQPSCVPLSELLVWQNDRQSWETFGALCVPRAYHASALDSSGRFLVISGGYSGHIPLSSVELLDLESAQSAIVGELRTPRANHATFPISSGISAVAGGQLGHQGLSSIEFTSWGEFLASNGILTEERNYGAAGQVIVGFLSAARYGATTITSESGDVYMIGGAYDGMPLASAERLSATSIARIAP